VIRQKVSSAFFFSVHGVAAASDCNDPEASEIHDSDDPSDTKPDWRFFPL
jgi:hypothetical protein